MNAETPAKESSHKIAYSVEEVTRQIPMSRAALYEEIKANRLKTKKLGRRRLILHDDLAEFLRNLPTS